MMYTLSILQFICQQYFNKVEILKSCYSKNITYYSFLSFTRIGLEFCWIHYDSPICVLTPNSFLRMHIRALISKKPSPIHQAGRNVSAFCSHKILSISCSSNYNLSPHYVCEIKGCLFFFVLFCFVVVLPISSIWHRTYHIVGLKKHFTWTNECVSYVTIRGKTQYLKFVLEI